MPTYDDDLVQDNNEGDEKFSVFRCILNRPPIGLLKSWIWFVRERVRRKTEGFYLSNWKDAGIINESELFLQNYVYTYNM